MATPPGPVIPVRVPSERVRLARLALATALATPGVAGARPGANGTYVSADGSETLIGVSVAAQPGGRYEVRLCLAAELVPLPALGRQVGERIRAATAASLGDRLGTVRVEFADVLEARS
jgi:hypothetical protein